MYATSQENFWANNFGNNYISRNNSLTIYNSKKNLFQKIFKNIDKNKISDIIELGANIGLNLLAIQDINNNKNVNYTAVEINKLACAELEKIKNINTINESILSLKITKQYDFTFTCGVLIHINPLSLNKVYQTLYDVSTKYICICEYYSPTPVSITYRGEEDKLFKRDFAGEMLTKFPELKLVDYGFVYHRDNSYPLDDITWFLLEKK